MAKNWTIAEAFSAVRANDNDAIQDLGKRYPLLLHKVTLLAAKAGAEAESLMAIMPEYVTANKLNKALMDDVDATENDGGPDEDDEQEQPKAKKQPAAKAKAKAAEPEDDDDEDNSADGDAPFDENMGSKEMYALCGKLGIKKTLKDTKKPTMVAALKKYYAEHGAGAADDDDADDEDGAADENPYEGKKAIDLFNECKKRGIKVKPKQPASVYANLLKKDDAAKADADEDGEDDGWDDGEDEADEKPAKKAAKKPEAKPSKKPAAKAKAKDDDDEDEADDDGDDNWDI